MSTSREPLPLLRGDDGQVRALIVARERWQTVRRQWRSRPPPPRSRTRRRFARRGRWLPRAGRPTAAFPYCGSAFWTSERGSACVHTTHGVHLNTQGVGLSLYQRYRYSLSSGTQGAGAVRYGPSPGTGGAGTGHPPVPPVHGALRCSMAGVPADF